MSRSLRLNGRRLSGRAAAIEYDSSSPLCDFCQQLVLWTRECTRTIYDEEVFHNPCRVENSSTILPPPRSGGQCPFCDYFKFGIHINTNPGFKVNLAMLNSSLKISSVKVGTDSYELLAEQAIVESELLKKRAIWRSGTPTFQERCKIESNVFPKRFIDVGIDHALDKVRLVSTHEIDAFKCLTQQSNGSTYLLFNSSLRSLAFDAFGTSVLDSFSAIFWGRPPRPSYTTLSHCWGQPDCDKPFTTTKTSEAQHKEAIAIINLPRTYRDAVEITRELGIQYLWIYSLCIIQDDLQGWQEESSKMASIYQSSFLNIAATSATDGNGGCFRDLPTYVPVRSSPTFPLSNRKVGLLEGASIDPNLHRTPLNQRGWVLQELVLSPRTVHFAEDKLYWQCRSWFESEDGLIAGDVFRSLGFKSIGIMQRRGGKFDLSNPTEAHQLWYQLMVDYCDRSFTYQKDKVPAMAGIIQYFQERTGGEPMLGLWHETLCFDLDWRSRGGLIDRVPELAHLPSWSWLSLRTPEKLFNTYEFWGRSVVRKLRVVQWAINWSGLPLTSELQSCVLQVASPLRVARQLKTESRQQADYWSNIGEYCEIPVSEEESRCVECLLLYSIPHVEHYLFILPVSKSPLTYRRVGARSHFFRGEQNSMFLGIPDSTIYLV